MNEKEKKAQLPEDSTTKIDCESCKQNTFHRLMYNLYSCVMKCLDCGSEVEPN